MAASRAARDPSAEAAAVTLPYRFLGNSGLKVSSLAMGTMTFGATKSRPGQTNEAESHKLLDQFAAAGGNFIDTANVYTNGESERIIGTWVASRGCRKSTVLATKFNGKVEDAPGYAAWDPNCRGCSRRHIIDALQCSLERLNTSWVDLLQQHCYDPGTPLDETLRTVNDLIRIGKVHYFGVSNFTGWQLQKAVCISQHIGLEPVIGLQQQYSLLCREAELESVPVCENEGIGLLPWSPLKGGVLTGKFSRDAVPDPSTRVGQCTAEGRDNQSHPSWNRFSDSPAFWRVMDAVTSVAESRGRTQGQVALRWLLQQPTVASVIIGAKTAEQLAENLACEGWQLTQEEMQTLSEASRTELAYPYEMQARFSQPRRRNPGCAW